MKRACGYPWQRYPIALRYSAVNQATAIQRSGRHGKQAADDPTSRAFHNDQLAPFYEEIAELTGSHKVLPMNSGAEAVESAIKSSANGATR